MALVAYSDESDISDTDSEPVTTNQPPNKAFQMQTNNKNDILDLNTVNATENKVTFGIDSIVDDDDDDSDFKLQNNLSAQITPSNINSEGSVLSLLPAAHPLASREIKLDINEDSDVLDDVPTADTWKITCQIVNDAPPPAKKPKPKDKEKKLRFILPALKEFDDEEEANLEEPPRKKIKASASGTGLFALLPSPKGITKPDQLVPKIVSRPKPDKKLKAQIKARKSTDSDGEEDSIGSSDFFSLSESVSTLPNLYLLPPNLNKNATALNIAPPEVTNLIVDPPEIPTITSTDNHVISPVDDPLPISTSESISSNISFGPQPNNVMDDEAIIRLAGRRNKGEIINLVDINADDALMSREEWMTKSLSEERPSHSFSRKKEGMPSQQQRRKHQITYLAHQAKERELELKTNWSQNRLTKMQTQAKYGF